MLCGALVAGESAAALTRLTMYNATGSITCLFPVFS
jgi:hypothetical protein